MGNTPAPQPDWFAQNSPPPVSTTGGDDWFASNAPKQSDNGEGFWKHVGTVLENQFKGAGKALEGGAGAGYDEYKQARANGEGVLSSLGKAAMATAARGVDPLGLTQEVAAGTAETAAGGYSKRRAEGYNPVYSAAAPTIAPVVGVNLPAMESAASKGHVSEVAAEAAVPATEAAAAYGASKALPAAAEKVAPAREFLSKKAVAPLVKKPLGATLDDIRFNRDPASAITDEGLMGTKQQIVQQANQRIAELSQQTDAMLQNHPNANAQIDANPIIDSAIDNAVKAAKKVGNKAAVARLNDLRDALKTEYGPTRGTPFDINNLKRDVGDAASDLGAFKATDPLESSAAGAMEDVYTGLKQAVNSQIPEVAPLNERVANLMSARTALNRSLAMEENRSVLSGLSMTNLPFKVAERAIGSAPVRTAAAQALRPASDLKKIPTVPPSLPNSGENEPDQRGSR